MAASENAGRLTVGFVLVGIIQIVGGGLGLYFVARAFFGETSPEPVADVIYAVAAVLFLISLLAGIQLLRVRKSGVYWSFLIQFLQLIQIQTQAIAYKFVSGAYLVAGITARDSDTEFSFNFEVLASSLLFYAPAPEGSHSGVEVYLNILALVIFIWLFRARHRVR